MNLKFLIYWSYYLSSIHGVHDISGVIMVKDSVLTTYLYPYDYYEWQIIDTHINEDSEGIITGTIWAKNNEVMCFVTFTPDMITEEIHHHQYRESITVLVKTPHYKHSRGERKINRISKQ